MRTSTETLEGNKVKLSVEVEEGELAKAEDETLRELAREARVPGFRPGKVPRRLLEVRLGHQAIRDEVIRHSVPDYYAQAVEEAALDAIAAPEIDITSGKEGGPLSFDAVVEVRPHVSIAGYEGLLVTLPSPVASEEEIDAQVDRLREQFGELKEVQRPALDKDFLTIRARGTRGGKDAEDLSADEFVYELGSGGLVPGADERLQGVRVGDIVSIDSDDGEGPIRVEVLVKLVREKVLPKADDAFAAEASEFSTIAELREDLAKRLTSVKRLQVNLLLRERALDALIDLVQEEVPAPLVAEQTEELLRGFMSRLSRQHVTLEQYLVGTGQSREQLISELESQGLRQAKADLALRALADAEDVAVSDEDLESEFEGLADQTGQSASQIRARVEQNDGLARLRSDLRSSRALTWLIENVAIVDEQGNAMDRSALREEQDKPDDPAGSAAADVEA